MTFKYRLVLWSGNPRVTSKGMHVGEMVGKQCARPGVMGSNPRDRTCAFTCENFVWLVTCDDAGILGVCNILFLLTLFLAVPGPADNNIIRLKWDLGIIVFSKHATNLIMKDDRLIFYVRSINLKVFVRILNLYFRKF